MKNEGGGCHSTLESMDKEKEYRRRQLKAEVDIEKKWLFFMVKYHQIVFSRQNHTEWIEWKKKKSFDRFTVSAKELQYKTQLQMITSEKVTHDEQ